LDLFGRSYDELEGRKCFGEVRNLSLLDEALVYNVLVSAHYVEMAMSCIDIMSIGKCHVAAGVEAKGDALGAGCNGTASRSEPLRDRIIYIINIRKSDRQPSFQVYTLVQPWLDDIDVIKFYSLNMILCW
jgi:hypothetical protein